MDTNHELWLKNECEDNIIKTELNCKKEQLETDEIIKNEIVFKHKGSIKNADVKKEIDNDIKTSAIVKKEINIG